MYKNIIKIKKEIEDSWKAIFDLDRRDNDVGRTINGTEVFKQHFGRCIWRI